MDCGAGWGVPTRWRTAGSRQPQTPRPCGRPDVEGGGSGRLFVIKVFVLRCVCSTDLVVSDTGVGLSNTGVHVSNTRECLGCEEACHGEGGGGGRCGRPG